MAGILFGYQPAAGSGRAVEAQHAQPRAAEVRLQHERVVARAQEDAVVIVVHAMADPPPSEQHSSRAAPRAAAKHWSLGRCFPGVSLHCVRERECAEVSFDFLAEELLV